MNCAFCNSYIEDDSFFCDQCGKEIFVCPTCGIPRKGKNCIEHGSKLISLKQKSENPEQKPEQEEKTVLKQSILSKTPVSPEKMGSPTNTGRDIPVLRLINNNLRMDIEIKDGDIIGNSNGVHKNTFSQFRKISGTHAKFFYDPVHGWMVVDVGSTGTGSTNGTYINSVPDWQNTPRLNPNQPYPIKDNSLLLIANLEFQVKINKSQAFSNTGTERI